MKNQSNHASQRGNRSQPANHRSQPPPAEYRLPDRQLILSILSISGFMILCTLVIAPVAAYAAMLEFDRIAPNVIVGGTPLYGLTKSQAAITLQAAYLNKEIILTNGIQTVTVSPSELGIEINPVETALKAYLVGRSGSFIAGAAEVLRSMNDGWHVQPVIIFNPEQARTGLERLAPELGRPPVNAGLRANGEHFSIVRQDIGYAINLEQSLASLAQNCQDIYGSGVFRVAIIPVLPAIEENELGPAMEEAQAFLAREHKIYTFEPVENKPQAWNIPKATLASWIRIDPGTTEPTIVLDPEGLRAYLQELEGQLPEGQSLDTGINLTMIANKLRQEEDVTLFVYRDPYSYTVLPGDTLESIGRKLKMPYWEIQRANPNIDLNGLAAGARLAIPSNKVLLTRPVIQNKRIIALLEQHTMQVFEYDQQIREFVISTGLDLALTFPGVFQVQMHENPYHAQVWDAYMPNFLGIYKAKENLWNGIHGLPELSNGDRVPEINIGGSVSFGGIIMRLDEAEWLYNWADDGVIVEIRP
jgi:hypothetical protein